MNIEQQVVSLELSKKLKELNVKQESYFYWEKCSDANEQFIISNVEYHDTISIEWGDWHYLLQQECYSAFCVAELGEMLPEYFYSCRMGNEPKNKWTADFHEASSIEVTWLEGNTEANVRAKMLIHLIENNLLGDEWRKKWLKG